jgi:lipopolysaccharide export system permease protein
MNENFDPVTVVHAQRGRIETDRANKQLLLHIYEGRFEQRDEKATEDLMKIRQGITMQESTIPISLTALYEKNKKKRNLGGMTVSELLNRSEPVDVELSEKERAGQLSAAKTEVSKRFSFALASLAFALIGVPLAITAHRKETSAGFLLSLVIAFCYFAFIIGADTVKNNPKLHPELLMWLPNVLFLCLGGVLFFRLSRR